MTISFHPARRPDGMDQALHARPDLPLKPVAPGEGTSSRRIQDLDAFRALAILAVMCFHFSYRWRPPNDPVDYYGFHGTVPWFQFGGLGVQFFFIISGFVIFMTIEAFASVADFGVRRLSRLYPTYLCCMIVTFLLVRYLGSPEGEPSLRQLLVGFSMASPSFGVLWVDGAYWSLLVEAKFYVYIAVLYFAFRRHFALAWLALCTVAAAASFVPHSG